MSERRKCHRFAIDPDRAQITVVVDSAQSPAIMADMSASGFGLLVLRGLPIESGHPIRVVTSDAECDCEVAYCFPEEMYQRVGVRRVNEYYQMPYPTVGTPRSWFKDDLTTANPLMFLGVVFGFSGLMIGVLSFLGIGGGVSHDERQIVRNIREVEQVMLAAPPVDAISEKEKQEAQERSQPIRETVNSLADKALIQKQQAAAMLTGSGDFNWSTLVSNLRLSGSQQRQILHLIENPRPASGTVSPLSPTEVRQRALGVLTGDQRSRITQMLATGGF